MVKWELITNGIRKYHSWGWVDIYMPVEDCFTKEELIQAATGLQQRQAIQAIGPDAAQILGKLKKKLKCVV